MIQLDNISEKELAEFCSSSTASANMVRDQHADKIAYIKVKCKRKYEFIDTLSIQESERIISSQDRVIQLAGKILMDLLK